MEKANSLIKWLETAILDFRQKKKNLPVEIQNSITNLEDLSTPCQVDVLWCYFGDNQIQIFFFTKDEQLPDLLINVYGPFNSESDLEGIQKFIQQDKYTSKSGQLFGTVSNEIEDMILPRLRGLKRRGLTGLGGKQIIGKIEEHRFTWEYRGQIQSVPVEKIVDDIISDARDLHKRRLENQNKPPVKNVEIKGFGAYIYPPVWIGELPRPTLKQKIEGVPLANFIKNSINQDFMNTRLLVQNDGYIVIFTPDKQYAVIMLNDILAALILQDVEVFSFKIHEISECTVYFNNVDYTNSGGNIADSTMVERALQEGLGKNYSYGTTGFTNIMLDTKRREPFSYYEFMFERNRISQEILTNAVETSKKYSQNESLGLILRFFLDSFTHLKANEFSQSFFLDWAILEQYINYRFDDLMQKRQFKESRKLKLERLQIDNKVEILEVSGDLDEEIYVKVDELRKKRNKFVHKLQPITREDAEKCYSLAKDCILNLCKRSFSSNISRRSGL